MLRHQASCAPKLTLLIFHLSEFTAAARWLRICDRRANCFKIERHPRPELKYADGEWANADTPAVQLVQLQLPVQGIVRNSRVRLVWLPVGLFEARIFMFLPSCQAPGTHRLSCLHIAPREGCSHHLAEQMHLHKGKYGQFHQRASKWMRLRFWWIRFFYSKHKFPIGWVWNL